MTDLSFDGLLYRVCPHWYAPFPNFGDSIMMDVVKREQCRLCGKFRVHARVVEPHPTRDKAEIVEQAQEPGYELVVDEWISEAEAGLFQ